MMPVRKIVIYGLYWDSFLYTDNLLLFGIDNSLKSFCWDKMVIDHVPNDLDALAYRCAFYQSDFLYGIRERALFEDSEIKEILRNKFDRICDIILDENELSKYRTFKTAIQLSHLPTDIDIYKNRLYYCNSDGVFYRNIRNQNEHSIVSPKEYKCWDAYIQCLKISRYGRIALCASSDGLFEINTRLEKTDMYDEFQYVDENIVKITDSHSSYCCWSFSSLLNGSYIEPSQLFCFKYNNDMYDMEYKKSFNSDQIFNGGASLDSFTISEGEKIYQISQNSIVGVNFLQRMIETNDIPFQQIVSKSFTIEEKIIDCAVVEFGVVIETQKSLKVILSTGEDIFTVNKNNEDIIRWRVFPRSTCYVNQLHVIYKDRIEIISFNDDYFVDQKTKQYGNQFFFK